MYITAKQTYTEKIKNFEQLYINQLENYVKIMKFPDSTTFHTGYKKKDRIKNKNKNKKIQSISQIKNIMKIISTNKTLSLNGHKHKL